MTKTILYALFWGACLATAATPGWVQLPNSTLNAVCPSGSCSAVVSAWSGATADTKRNRLIIWGGGHGDYNGNEVYALYLAGSTPQGIACSSATAPAICRLTASEANPDTSQCPAALPSGNPNGRHTYNQLAYISFADRMLAFNGSLSCQTGAHLNDLWTLAFANLSWQRMDPAVGAQQPDDYYDYPGGLVAYDPNTQLVFIDNLEMLFTYNFQTNTYTRVQPNTTPPFNSTMVVDPKRKYLYYIGNTDGDPGTNRGIGTPAIKAIDISAGSNYQMQDWSAQVTGCAGLTGAYSPGVAYDSAIDKFVGWPNFGNTVYIFDPVAKSCTTQTFSGGPPDSTDYNGNSYTTGTFGRFQYFPALDAFAVVNSAANGAYLLTLDNAAAGATGGAGPSAPSVTSFTASSASMSAGGSVTLSWVTSGATTTNITPTVGVVAASGSTTVSPSATTTYTLTATNAAGSATASTVVSVIAQAAPPTITSFTTSAASISAGNSASLSWITSGATTISIVPTVGAVAASGSTMVSPSTTTTYTLTATNAAGSATTTATVNVVAGGAGANGAPANTIKITNNGSTTTNYPVQIGRPFVQGEIPSGQLPQASVNGTPLSTQVDVKQRWSDGSLKHAIVSFMIPTFTASTTYTVTFASGTTVGNTALTQSQMLDTSYNFDAAIQLSKNGVNKSASARTMLTNGDYKVWASGPIATTIILANHAQGMACAGGTATGTGTTSSKYDFGFDSYCPFRPIFEATFWPTTHQVWVRYIGELANTQQIEDMPVDTLTLTIGSSSPSTWYTKSSFNMWARSRWTKTAWIGGTPPVAGINHNVGYLSATKFIANYNTVFAPSSTAIAAAYSSWTRSSRDLYQPGMYDPIMGDTGARPGGEIGPYPWYTIMWLYTGDYRMQEAALGMADLAEAWWIHYREGDATKHIDRARTISGLGHVYSISEHKDAFNNWGDPTKGSGIGYNTPAQFAVGTVGVYSGTPPYSSSTGWNPDMGHVPAWSPIYTVTGDYWYLEQNWFWAGYNAGEMPGATGTADEIGRGPTGAEGAMSSDITNFETRAQGWGYRNRVETAFISPDGTPEQSYFDLLAKDTIAAWEGERNITGTANQGNTMWTWANQWATNSSPACSRTWCSEPVAGYVNGVPTAIHFWAGQGHAGFNENPESTAYQAAGKSFATWETNTLIFALGRAKELGYATDALLNWVGPWLISQATDPNYNPWLLGGYRFPTTDPTTGQYFTTWAQIKAAMCTSAATGCSIDANAQTATTFGAPIAPYIGDAVDPTGTGSTGTPLFAGVALSYLTNQTNGQAAWNFINAHAMSLPENNDNPKFAIIPRSSASPSSPALNACDLNSDGVVNNVDVQLAVNQALGIVPCTTAGALQHNGQCTVVGVQEVINTSLGGACVTH